MADNVVLKSDAATVIDTAAADDIGGVKYQRVKVTWGADGTANDADTASGKALPVQFRDAGGNAVFPSNATAVAAGTAANTVVKGLAGRLWAILVTASGTNAMSVFDNATTNSGTVIGYIPANTPAGSVFTFQMPAANGITVGGNANNPGVTLAYS